MKNKLLFSTFLALFCAFIIGCGSNSSQKGANIFNGKLDSVQKINYVLPDETVKTIDNKEDVKLICDILSNQVYSEVDNSSQICQVKYDAYSDKYSIHTDDGYHWEVRVYQE